MQFKPSRLNRFYKTWHQWVQQSPTERHLQPIHQSNPQPFSLQELESIIGPCAELWQPDLKLAYAAGAGSETLRETITDLYAHDQAERIATFCGAQEAIFCCLNALLEAGDKLVAITPIFEPLINPARDLGCEIQMVSLQAEQQWSLDLDQLEAAIKDNAKVLLLNFPHNPTGAMISRQQLDQIIDICTKYDCWILSDEVFRGLEYDPADRLPSVADLSPKAISISVLSKAFALPALRVAWIHSQDPEMINRCLQIKDYLSICNSLIDEQIATRVIQHHADIFARNRQLIIENLDQLIPLMNKLSLDFLPPTAGCIGFPLLPDQSNADELATHWITEHGLMVLPGELFLGPQNGFRLGFGYSENIHLLNQLIEKIDDL